MRPGVPTAPSAKASYCGQCGAISRDELSVPRELSFTRWILNDTKILMIDYSSNLTPPGGPDALSQMLCGLRLDGGDYGRCRLSGEWSFFFPKQAEAHFHFIAGKGCWFSGPDGEWSELEAGDAVLMPRGAFHVLASAPGLEPRPFPRREGSPICETVFDYPHREPIGGDVSIFFCGTMQFNLDELHPLMRMMPEVMQARDLMTNEPAIMHLMEAMIAECAMNRAGASGILARLADVMAAQIIRSWLEHGCSDSEGWIAAMRDPQIGQALVAIHADPKRDWTLPGLAALAGMSRSAFAAAFAKVVGQTPARYLTEVRMHLARQWILRNEIRIAQLPELLGYDSEAAFSRAFKRVIGAPPSSYRKRDMR